MRISSAVLVLFLLATGYAAGEYDVDAEISRIRRELNQVQSERQRVKEEAAQDRKDFADYVERTQKRFARVKEETDSIQAQIRDHRQTADSLAALVTSVQSNKRQYEMLQDQFRNRLVAGCDRLAETAGEFPPMASKSMVSSISYLRSELASKTIDNVEGTNRITQIVKDMNENTSNIQIVQGTPPVGELRGTCYGLRIGAVFEASVEAKGGKTAIWQGYNDDGSPRWRIVEDPAVAGQVLEAVNVREGKALPSFVALPFRDEQQPVAHVEEGGEK